MISHGLQFSMTADVHTEQAGGNMDIWTHLSDIPFDQTVRDRTFWEDDSRVFFAMISIAPIVDGHTLICPTIPLGLSLDSRSFYDAIFSGGLMREALCAVEAVTDLLRVKCKEEPAFFEHGGRQSAHCPSACGTAYPHLHVIPRRLSIASSLAESWKWRSDRVRQHSNLSEFYNSPRGAGEYLLISDNSGTFAIWSGSDRVFPSQTLRHATQEDLQLELSTWQDIARRDGAAGAISQARSLACLASAGC